MKALFFLILSGLYLFVLWSLVYKSVLAEQDFALPLAIGAIGGLFLAFFIFYFSGIDNQYGRFNVLRAQVAAMDEASDAVIVIRGDGTILSVNEKMRLLLNLSHSRVESFVRADWNWLLSASSVYDFVRKRHEIVEGLESQGMWEGVLCLGDGSSEPDEADEPDDVECCKSFYRIEKVAVPQGGWVLKFTDMSELHQLRHDRERVQQRLFACEKMEMLGRLSSGIAHDFNNILASVIGFAEFLEEDLEDQPSEQDFVKQILKSGDDAKVLIAQLLNFSASETADKSPLRLDMVVKNSLDILKSGMQSPIVSSYNNQAADRYVNGRLGAISYLLVNGISVCLEDIALEDVSLDVHVDLFGSGRVARLVNDEEHIQSSHTSSGEGYYVQQGSNGELRAQCGHVDGDKLYLGVHIDIESDDLRIGNVLRAFGFVDEGQNAELIRSIIGDQDGVLCVQTGAAGQIRINVYFPEYIEADNVSTHHQRAVDIVDDEKASRILLVEDQVTVRMMLEKMLGRMGHQVSSCVSGNDALDEVRNDPYAYDVVITDQTMPGMTGLQLAQELELDFDDLPVIIISGFSKTNLEEGVKKCSLVQCVLSKPVDRGRIQEALETSVGKMPRGSALLLSDEYDDEEDDSDLQGVL